jgi:outer membrane cobalamin receptor
MEDSVKKFLVLFITSLFMLIGAGLYSQAVTTDEKAAEKVTEKSAEKKKNPTRTFEMGEIVVKDRAIASVEDASTTTEITDKDIKARNEKTLGDSLQMVPGIQVTTASKGNTNFSLRGFDQDKVVVLVDGIPVNDVYSATFDISQIPVMNVAKIVVNRGVSSALYGSNGSIGSINVITKRPEDMTTEISTEYGQYNNYMLNVANGAPIGDAYYWITASVLNSDGYAVSDKLDKSERTKWFDKFVKPAIYGQTVTLKAKDSYINDTGSWDHTEYTKYQLAGKLGYNFTDKIETGLSASYYHNEQKSNTFRANCFSSYSYDTGNGWYEWNSPPAHGFNDTNRPGRDVFQNRAFYWPEKYDMTISPYFKGEFGIFTLKSNIFYYKQYTDLEGYGAQDHSFSMFPASVDSAAPNDMYNSIWTEQSYGINVYPSVRIADWNRLNFALTYRSDSHTEEEKAVSATLSPDVWAVHGGDKYKTDFLAADFITVAIEDELNFNKKIEVSVGASYDAQNFTDNKTRITATDYDDAYMIEDDSMIWGTRDSFNFTAAVVWDTVEDLLKLRAAASSKTKFPTLSAYADIADDSADKNLKSERAYNGNLGFEVTPLGELLGLRMDYFYSRFKDKIEEVWSETYSDDIYTNIDGVTSQGVETIISSKIENVAGIVDISSSLSYTYIRARIDTDIADSDINRGNKLENTPEHMFTADIRFNFITDTSLNIYGTHTRNQIVYAMKSAPATGVSSSYSTEYFEAVDLHNPIMFNVKLSQKIFNNFDLFVLCRNILDDYNADPFNPGAGRLFSFGGGAQF